MAIRKQILSSRARVAMTVLGACSLFLSAYTEAAVITPGAPSQSTPGNFTFAGLTQVDLPGPGNVPADETFTVTAYDTSGNARYTAAVESKVLLDPSGYLDFAYQVTNLGNTGLPDSLHTVSVTSYRGYTTNVDYVSGTGQVTYDTVDRLAVAQGVTLTFDYTPVANNIASGDATDWILIKTNATSFDNNGTTQLIDGATASVESFKPVPEPVSLGFLASAGLLLVARPVRRNRSAK